MGWSLHSTEPRAGVPLAWLAFTLLAGGIVHTLACWLALQLDFFRGGGPVFYRLFAVIWVCGLLLFVLGLKPSLLRLNKSQVIGIILCWSTLVVLVSAFFVDQLRLCIMVFFFGIVQTGVFHATRRLLIFLGVFATLGYALILVVVHLFYPTMIDWSTELVQWLAFTGVAAAAMFLAVDISTLRRVVEVRNRQLTSIVTRIQNMAMHDELTGLHNRRSAMEQLTKLRELAGRGEISLHIAYLDLDHFKRTNDTYGHGFGDVVLKRFAVLLQENTTKRDFVARIGGEEFVMVLVKVTADEALARLERLRTQWQENRFDEHPELVMTLSAGMGEFCQHESLAEWMTRADTALYEAKTGGRNRIRQLDCPRQEATHD